MTNFLQQPSLIMDYIKPDVSQLLEMLTYRRAEGSSSQKGFCRKFLLPAMGRSDAWGNYHHVVGSPTPRIAYMAHHDTVHLLDGQQTVVVDGDYAVLPSNSKSNCLGADCTTGVWLILHMIKCGVPGRYIIHAGEEIGAVGARHIVDSEPEWFDQTEVALSFDRKGFDSIITHQGQRTASDDFAHSLNAALQGGFKLDPKGVFTDSYIYSKHISECSNLSVGYFNQHTKFEKQNLNFAADLADHLVLADWSTVKAYRDVNVIDFQVPCKFKTFLSGWGDYDDMDIEDIIKENPRKVAKILREFGMDKETLIDELNLYEEENW